MKLEALLIVPLLCCCGGGFESTSVSASPAGLKVSGWDSKEVKRAGSRGSEHNVSSLRANGFMGLVARSAKGNELDTKFASFIRSADREGMLVDAPTPGPKAPRRGAAPDTSGTWLIPWNEMDAMAVKAT